MTLQRVRRAGNSYAITITREEMERLRLHEGDFVGVEFRKMELRPTMPPALQAAAEESWSEGEAAYRYLAER
jgi:antitoxin component of MazEF toxin-antitoxin module